MRYPFASTLVSDIGPELGIVVELEPDYGFAGELIFPGGKRHLFRNTNFNINAAGSTEIAKDKGYTNYFLGKHGIKVPRNRAFFSTELNSKLACDKRRYVDDAAHYASSLGFPVYVKPNNLSEGEGVTKVFGPDEIASVAESIFRKTDVMLVEEACPGRDYRVVVLADRIISAYERIPLSVIGDGQHTIQELLEMARDELQDQGRPNTEIDPSDPRIDRILDRMGFRRTSVPPRALRLAVLDNANLSTGGTSVDVTESIHPSFASIATSASKVLGLRLAGVDILCDDLEADAGRQVWNVIEVNASPGLDNYAALGDTQAQRVRALYRSILEYLSTHEMWGTPQNLGE